MIYLAEMLRDCSKNRATSFTQLSFPIIQEIQSKIRGKNSNLRKKMKLRLLDRQRLLKNQQKKQEAKIDAKKEGSNSQKVQKQTINYIQAYQDIKNNQQNKFFNIQLEDLKLDERDHQICYLVYNLIRKKKPIFKADEIKRKLKNKEHPKRISFKECDCCEKIGKHKCQHKFCEGKCQKLRRAQRVQQQALITEDRIEDYEALNIAQDIIDKQAKQENIQLPFIRITKIQEQPLILPKIDITEKQEHVKDQMDGQLANQRERISQNQSKSSISQSVIKKNEKNSQQSFSLPLPLKQSVPINQQLKNQYIQGQIEIVKLQILKPHKNDQQKIINKEKQQQMIVQQQNHIKAKYNDLNEQMAEEGSQQDDLEQFEEIIPEQQIKISRSQIKIAENPQQNIPSPIKTTKSQIQIIVERKLISPIPINQRTAEYQKIEPLKQKLAALMQENKSQFNEQSGNFIDHLLQQLVEDPLDENQFLME